MGDLLFQASSSHHVWRCFAGSMPSHSLAMTEDLQAKTRNRIPAKFLLAALLVTGLWIVWGQLSPSGAQSEDAMIGGARHVTIQVPGKTLVTLSLVCFREDKFRMSVVTNLLPPADRHIAGKALDTRAVAGCNGGYFATRDLKAYGLEIAEGVTSGKFVEGGPLAALFGIRNDAPFIATEKEFHLTPEISGLVQCSPLLVDQGWIFHDTGDIAVARTFVMTDGKGQWAIGSADRLTLNDLATLLARPGLVQGFRVQRAMNLDGGPSTGLWWQDRDGKAHEQRERWRVRNMIMVVPR